MSKTEQQSIPAPLKWHPKSADQAHNGSIYYELFQGHAYAVAVQPQYVTDEQWKLYAEAIVTAVNTHPVVADLVKALEKARAAIWSGGDTAASIIAIDSALSRFRELEKAND